MVPESLRRLQQAVRINPSAKIAAIAQEHPKSKDALAESLIDVYVGISPTSKGWTHDNWDAMLEELDNDPRTLSEFMDTPAVRALARSLEAHNAAS